MDKQDKVREHFCVDNGHSKVVTVDWGRVYCARCNTKLVDGLVAPFDNSKWVFCEPNFECFGCDHCKNNYHNLSYTDIAMLPQHHVDAMFGRFGANGAWLIQSEKAMPCESRGLEEHSSAAWKTRCDKVTSFLCEACTVLDAHEVKYHGGLFDWWQKHKRDDD